MPFPIGGIGGRAFVSNGFRDICIQVHVYTGNHLELLVSRDVIEHLFIPQVSFPIGAPL